MIESRTFPTTFKIFQMSDKQASEGVPDTERDHSAFHLFAPLCHGETCLKINGTVVHDGRLKSGMLRLSSPDDREERLVRKPLQAVSIRLSASFLSGIFARHDYQHKSAGNCFMTPILNGQPLVQRLVSAATLGGELEGTAKSVYLDGVAEALVGLLIDNHQSCLSATTISLTPPLSRGQLRDCIAFADAMLGQKLSVGVWANNVHLSASEFGRRFQRSTGQTPYAWLIGRRIEKSQILLRNTTTTMPEVALSLGFASQSHFSEAFRRRTGSSPSRWRKSFQNLDKPAVC